MHAPAAPDQPGSIPPEILLLAYRSGVFPMADARDDDEVFWVEPRKRAILPLDGFRCSRSLARVLKQDRYRVTLDADFPAVIAACAAPRPDHPDTWISTTIEASFLRLYEQGVAHSVECWAAGENGEELVGGLYGVAVDRLFCGESMFSRADNASKVALAWLVAMMRRAGFMVLDCQFMTEHLASLGAVEIHRDRYQAMIADACASPPERSLAEAYASLSASSPAGSPSEAAGSSPPSSPGKLIAQSFSQTS
ncbi:leucyl/phenylalanyl-tRNA--protein transferase [Aurantiacibacter arachoides]|nr:leucyl/phenylalanyl-tRNA--protein transferase [Aurantiacibacter arachoides]GGD65392.1 leucyl/phenylalanyl-tRNA--protein transferase [Aurantiacibacter arachoides]